MQNIRYIAIVVQSTILILLGYTTVELVGNNTFSRDYEFMFLVNCLFMRILISPVLVWHILETLSNAFAFFYAISVCCI